MTTKKSIGQINAERTKNHLFNPFKDLKVGESVDILLSDTECTSIEHLLNLIRSKARIVRAKDKTFLWRKLAIMVDSRTIGYNITWITEDDCLNELKYSKLQLI